MRMGRSVSSCISLAFQLLVRGALEHGRELLTIEAVAQQIISQPLKVDDELVLTVPRYLSGRLSGLFYREVRLRQ